MYRSYQSTSVSVSKSQSAIRELMMKFDVQASQIEEDFIHNRIQIRFRKNDVNVRLSVDVNRSFEKLHKAHPRTKAVELMEQAKKMCYRFLHDWLKAQFNAVEFGILTFEDVFLSHFEYQMQNGAMMTIGERVIPLLQDSKGIQKMLLTPRTGEDTTRNEKPPTRVSHAGQTAGK